MPKDRENPFRVVRKTRETDWDPIRGLHQGQRPSTPRTKAGHMTAPDQFVETLIKILACGSHPHRTLRDCLPVWTACFHLCTHDPARIVDGGNLANRHAFAY